MKNKHVTSEPKKKNLLLLLIGGAVMLLVSSYMIKNSLSDDYVQIIQFILGGIFGIAGIACLIIIFFLESLVLENGKLKIISFRGKIKKEISIDEIEGFKEIEKENNHSKWKDLTIFTKTSKYTISSYSHSNYELLQKALIKGKKKNSYAEKMWHFRMQRRYGICMLIVGIIFLSLLGRTYLKKDLKISQDVLVKIEGTVLNRVEVKKSGKRNKNRSIEIELEEYPKFKFQLGEKGLNATRVNKLISNVQKGEQIEIEIFHEQLQKKLTNEIPMDFWDKNINYREIGIYGLHDEENSYFDLEEFNRNKESDRNSWAMYLLLGFSFFIS